MIIRKQDGSECSSTENIAVGEIIEIKTPYGFKKGIVISKTTKTAEQVAKEIADMNKK